MVRRSLIAAACLAFAAPLSAQAPGAEPEEWRWTADRPDANAPQGVFGSRTLASGEMEVGYRWYQTNWQGLYVGRDSIGLGSTLQSYPNVPTSRSDIRHEGRFAFGVTNSLTFVARVNFAQLERDTETLTSTVRTSIDALGDLELGVLYKVIDQGPYRLHLQGGAMVPIGKVRTYADTTAAQSGSTVSQPYDMRPGSGSFGAVAGMTGSVQNEVGSVGAQFRARGYFDTNGSGYRLGNDYTGSGWAAYNINAQVSVSGGVRWHSWSHIEGVDPTLNLRGDPHNFAPVLAGQRAMLPLGINFRFPPGSVLSSHMLAIEAVYSLHHDLEAPQLGLDWGLNVGWTMAF